MLNLPDDGEMTDLTEYLQMKQYHNHQIYLETTIHSQTTRENMQRSSRKPFITTVESYSTP
eukprot:2956767-Amphidinium_carterae.1